MEKRLDGVTVSRLWGNRPNMNPQEIQELIIDRIQQSPKTDRYGFAWRTYA